MKRILTKKRSDSHTNSKAGYEVIGDGVLRVSTEDIFRSKKFISQIKSLKKAI